MFTRNDEMGNIRVIVPAFVRPLMRLCKPAWAGSETGRGRLDRTRKMCHYGRMGRRPRQTRPSATVNPPDYPEAVFFATADGKRVTPTGQGSKKMTDTVNPDVIFADIGTYNPAFLQEFGEKLRIDHLRRVAPDVANNVEDVVEVVRNRYRLIGRAMALAKASLQRNGDMWAQRSLSVLNILAEILKNPDFRGLPEKDVVAAFAASGPDAGFFPLMLRATDGEFGASVARGATAMLSALPGGIIASGSRARFGKPSLPAIEAADMMLLPIRNEVDTICMMRDRVMTRSFAKVLANDLARKADMKLSLAYEMVAALYNAQSWNHLSARLA